MTLNTSCTSKSKITDEAGVLKFTPDKNTPDLIYYQSVTQANLGWKIHVVDATAPSILDVNCDHFGSHPIQLTNDLAFYAIVNPVENTITIEVVYNGLAWISVAFTDNEQPSMVGAEAVIGIPFVPTPSTRTPSPQNGTGTSSSQQDGGERGQPKTTRTTNPAKYHLNAKTLAGVEPMPPEQQTLINATIAQTATLTILKFTKRLVEPGEHPIYADRPNLLLFAHGSHNDLESFHTSFGAFELLPNHCAVSINGEIQNEYALSQQDEENEIETVYLDQMLWIVHGACAAIAWGVLVPLAIGASIIRKVLVKMFGLSENAWFQIHRTLNVAATLLTFAAFALAVRAVTNGTMAGTEPDHFRGGIAHRRAGLVIFLLTVAQVVNGFMRPREVEVSSPRVLGDRINRHETESLAGISTVYRINPINHHETESWAGISAMSRTNLPETDSLSRVSTLSRMDSVGGSHSDFLRLSQPASGKEEDEPSSPELSRAEGHRQRALSVDVRSNEGSFNKNDEKGPERAVWETSHRFYGFLLLILTWWQVSHTLMGSCQNHITPEIQTFESLFLFSTRICRYTPKYPHQVYSGVGLFSERFESFDLDYSIFCIVITAITGTVGFLAIFARIAL